MKKLFILFSLISSLAHVHAYERVQDIPNPKTTNIHSYVSNPDGIISTKTIHSINILLDSLNNKTGAEVAVVVINSIGKNEINSFANNLYNLWGIGKKKESNGLLILFVKDIKRIKFEVGYGLEGVMPDAICKRIQIQTMIPYFKKGNYDAGLLAGVIRSTDIISKEPVNLINENLINWKEVLPYAVAAYLLLALITFILLFNTISSIRKNNCFRTNIERYKAIKNQKNGIVSIMSVILPVISVVLVFLFSHPFFLVFILPIPLNVIPGIIYAQIMMYKIRREPIQCNVCDGQMHMLSEKKEDIHLELSQQLEEKLQAVDYDVFVCKKCSNELIYTLDKPSAYSNCPKCSTKAFIQTDKHTLISPTYFNGGTERTTYQCKYCGYEEHKNNHTPRLSKSSGAIIGGTTGGFFSGSGGFGSGGIGGNFGGGNSGGGGASSGW